MENRITWKQGKKWFALVLALLLCIPSFAALAADDTVELTYWAHSGTQDSIAALTDAYCAAHPNVKVTVSYYATDDIKAALKVAASSGTLPDMWFNWGGNLGGYYVQNGCTYDLTEYAAAHNWADKISASALALCTLDGQLAGYPTNISMLSVYFNKAVFDQNGLTVPTTFAELETLCETLKAKGVVPFSTAGLYGWHVMRIVEQLVEYYAGPELHDQLQGMSTSWNCDAVIQALTKYQEWCQKGYFPEGFVSNSPDDTLMLLATGQAAMDVEGQWFDRTAANDGLSVDDFGMFEFPNDTGRISAFAEMVQLNKNLTDAKLDAAVDFLSNVFSNESAASENGSMLNLPLPLKDAVIPESQPHAIQIFDYAKTNGAFTITDQAFPTVVADVLFDMQDALASGTTTPADAAAAIEAAAEAYRTGK